MREIRREGGGRRRYLLRGVAALLWLGGAVVVAGWRGRSAVGVGGRRGGVRVLVVVLGVGLVRGGVGRVVVGVGHSCCEGEMDDGRWEVGGGEMGDGG